MNERLAVCVFAEMTYPARVRDQRQDMAVYQRLRPWVERFYLVVTSSGDTVHVTHHGNVVGVHIPYRHNPIVRRLRYWSAAWAIARRLVRRRRIDLVMAAEPLVGGPLAVLVARAMRLPVLVHIQGDLLHLPTQLVHPLKSALVRRLTVAVARRADRVRCISHGVREACIRAGIRADRLAVLPVRCDFDWFDPDRWRAARRSVRDELGIGDGQRVIVSVGAFSVHKGYSVLLEAFARLRAHDAELRLLLIGEGPLRPELEARCRALSIESGVRIPGWAPYDRVPPLLAAGDVYVQPSFDEGIPRAALEAMAMQLPVVATRVGGVPELIDDGETGLLVPAGDVDALSGAIRRLLESPEWARRLGQTARNRTRERYAIDAGIRSYGGLLVSTARRELAAA